MNREIKFRAWHKDAKLMLYESPDQIFYWLKEQPIEIMQYTGLKDKNGNEIYEGDIVEAGMWRYIVCFERGRFVCKYSPNDRHLAGYVDGTELVMGNIYENPESL